ncbi:hypothetical protein D029_4558A, partial [Vibrio parahaemolyticus 970107]
MVIVRNFVARWFVAR